MGGVFDEFPAAMDVGRIAAGCGPHHRSPGQSTPISDRAMGCHDVSLASEQDVQRLYKIEAVADSANANFGGCLFDFLYCETTGERLDGTHG